LQFLGANGVDTASVDAILGPDGPGEEDDVVEEEEDEEGDEEMGEEGVELPGSGEEDEA
jgi:hypothetical protein